MGQRSLVLADGSDYRSFQFQRLKTLNPKERQLLPTAGLPSARTMNNLAVFAIMSLAGIGYLMYTGKNPNVRFAQVASRAYRVTKISNGLWRIE